MISSRPSPFWIAVGQLGLGIPAVIFLVMGMMILPLPPILLDLLFSFNISLSLVVLLSSIYTKKPLDFAVFPTVLLLTTLLRLALNVASTRAVLLHGHEGGAAAGHVIESFGTVVIGGNYAVGLVVFSILVIINFIVVTKGAGRISEVSARFVLDAMPGKQMAIDADLNAGLISQEDAKKRRLEVSKEADFYGSMDGASKFVRGDAVAGILVLFINLIGGVLIGITQHNMNIAPAFSSYALLTIGDGLVAQIPALFLSIASAILVTRMSSDHDMDTQMANQLFRDARGLKVTAAVLIFMGLIPNMPHLAFIGMGTASGLLAYFLGRLREDSNLMPEEKELSGEVSEEDKNRELEWEDVQSVDTLGLEVGYRLIPLVDKNQGGKLIERIRSVRKMISQDLGFLIPPVHIRDNLELQPGTYRVTLLGVAICEYTLHMEKLMAINPGQVFGKIDGIPCSEPAFGMEAFWIDPSLKNQAQTMGYTVVDPASVLVTHLSHLMRQNAQHLLGHEEVQQLINRLGKTAPKLVESLIPDGLPLSTLVRIFHELLEERVSIRDIRTICETLVEVSHRTKDPQALLSATRIALGRQIVQSLVGLDTTVPVLTLAPELERLLLSNAEQPSSEGSIGIEPHLAERIQSSLKDLVRRQEVSGKPSILLVAAPLRYALSRFLRVHVPGASVLSYLEIPEHKSITIVGTIG